MRFLSALIGFELCCPTCRPARHTTHGPGRGYQPGSSITRLFLQRTFANAALAYGCMQPQCLCRRVGWHPPCPGEQHAWWGMQTGRPPGTVEGLPPGLPPSKPWPKPRSFAASPTQAKRTPQGAAEVQIEAQACWTSATLRSATSSLQLLLLHNATTQHAHHITHNILEPGTQSTQNSRAGPF